MKKDDRLVNIIKYINALLLNSAFLSHVIGVILPLESKVMQKVKFWYRPELFSNKQEVYKNKP